MDTKIITDNGKHVIVRQSYVSNHRRTPIIEWIAKTNTGRVIQYFSTKAEALHWLEK